MTSIASKSMDKKISLLIKVFIFINLLCPYVNKISYRNCTLILGNVFIGMAVMLLIVKKNIKNADNIFVIFLFIILVIYNVLAFINNVQYNNYYIEQINKSISFMFFISILSKIDYEFLKKNNVITFLLKTITLSLVLSIIYHFVIGGDAIRFENYGVDFSRRWTFSDDRLTWVFGHKSTYALMLVLFISIGLKFKDFFKRKKEYIFFIVVNLIVAKLISSATLIILLILIFTTYYIKNYNFKKYKIIALLLIPIVIIFAILAFYCAFNVIGKQRDLSTIGSRTYIYKAAIDNIKYFPNGVGKDFGNIFVNAQVVQVENFHNIFLNEIFRFSIPVGFMYFLLHILVSFRGISINRDIFSLSIICSCFVMFFIDYSLRTEQLSIYLFLIYICIYVKEN
ncbi:hypothetical protein [Clostridium butyricum]|uniref:O-antigen ligase-related domain-containing protein n=1 Tax=Clostridium butyricum TaxID=1492 RepID=A0A6N3BT91_CLOBU